MGMINLPREQMEALLALDAAAVDKLIDAAMRDERTAALRQALMRCGEYVGRELRSFEMALVAHGNAKTARKRKQTFTDLFKAKYDLSHAVYAMKRRADEDRRDAELFVVEDAIHYPHFCSRKLSVNVHYRWRRSPEEAWKYGAIEFTHNHDPRPDYPISAPRRKISKAQQDRALQAELDDAWQDLLRSSLCAVRDYFKAGRDGALIPKTFAVRPDSYSRRLNNFSTKFWVDGPSNAAAET